MFAVLFTVLRCLLPRPGNHRQLVLENLALRHQILVLKHEGRRPKLRSVDRWLRVMLQSCQPDWKAAALIFRPETVIGWQRAGFRPFGAENHAPAAGRGPRDRFVRCRHDVLPLPVHGGGRHEPDAAQDGQ